MITNCRKKPFQNVYKMKRIYTPESKIAIEQDIALAGWSHVISTEHVDHKVNIYHQTINHIIETHSSLKWVKVREENLPRKQKQLPNCAVLKHAHIEQGTLKKFFFGNYSPK